MDIDAQIADTLGALDGFHTPAHDDAESIRALGVKLRYLEQRRHHDSLAAAAAENQDAIRGHLNTLADALKEMLANQAEPRDHTVIESRALGVKLRLVGKNGDPLLAEVASALVPTIERLAAAQGQRVSDETTQDGMDRAADRKIRLDKGTLSDAPSED